MKISMLLLIQTARQMSAYSPCAKAVSQFWAEYYKNEPTFIPGADNQVIIRWQTIIPPKMYKCVQLIELHEISISSVSVLKQHILGTEINQFFHIQVQDICTNSQQIYKSDLFL